MVKKVGEVSGSVARETLMKVNGSTTKLMVRGSITGVMVIDMRVIGWTF